MLHPFLTAIQDGNFKGTEGFGAIPFDGVVLAHSNESEWKSFRNNKNNEAFLDRIYIVKVGTSLRSWADATLRAPSTESIWRFAKWGYRLTKIVMWILVGSDVGWFNDNDLSS